MHQGSSLFSIFLALSRSLYRSLQWKWNNDYSISNIQYNTNLLNLLNKEIKKKPKYGFYLMSSLNENKDSLTK